MTPYTASFSPPFLLNASDPLRLPGDRAAAPEISWFGNLQTATPHRGCWQFGAEDDEAQTSDC